MHTYDLPLITNDDGTFMSRDQFNKWFDEYKGPLWLKQACKRDWLYFHASTTEAQQEQESLCDAHVTTWRNTPTDIPDPHADLSVLFDLY